MKRIGLAMAALAAMATVEARADVVGIQLGGAGGISGTVVVSYGPHSDMKYPGQGFKITGVSGTFSDATLGIFRCAHNLAGAELADPSARY
jgi:hypothetical protein